MVRLSIKLVAIALALIISYSLYYFEVGKESEIRFLQQVWTIERASSELSDREVISLLTQVGSRRLSQSVAAYAVSTPFGRGLGKGKDHLISETANTQFDLSVSKRIVDKQGGPSSYFSQVSFEVGYVLFAVSISLWGWLIFRLYKVDSWLFLSFGIWQLLFFSTSTGIFGWLFIALSLSRKGESNIG
jgi:hypothetical protein